MFDQPRDFSVWPVLFPANQTSVLTITANELAFIPSEQWDYRVRINAIEAFAEHLSFTDHFTFVDVRAKNGALRFEYSFGEEGPYSIVLYRNEKELATLQVYALEKDLYERRPLKGDLHIHSYRSDGKRCPTALPGYYREHGFDFMIITDHNRYNGSEEAIDAYKDIKLGMQIYTGEELHPPGCFLHIVHTFGKTSVARIYCDERERYEAGWQAKLRDVPSDIPEKYHKTFAMAMWASEEIHKADGLAILPHPYWIPVRVNNSYNIPTEFATILLKSGLFDAYELIGGMHTQGNNLSMALFSDLRAEGFRLPVVASSDAHNYETGGTFPRIYSVVFAKDFSREGVMEAVKSGYTVPVECEGEASTETYNAYGSVRFVRYVRFLIDNYFHITRQLAKGEGIMMRNYLAGLEDGELLSQMAGRVDRFYRKFAGIDEPMLPSEEMLAFEEKWRAVQRTTPESKGGSLEILTPNAARNI